MKTQQWVLSVSSHPGMCTTIDLQTQCLNEKGNFNGLSGKHIFRLDGEKLINQECGGAILVMAVKNAMSGNCLVEDLPNIYLVNKRISSPSLRLSLKSSLIFFPSW